MEYCVHSCPGVSYSRTSHVCRVEKVHLSFTTSDPFVSAETLQVSVYVDDCYVNAMSASCV